MFKPSLYLVGHQGREAFFLHNLLKDKTGMEKLWLVLKCVPLFSLNTLFRVGSAVPKVDKVFTFKCPLLHRSWDLSRTQFPPSRQAFSSS